MTDQRVRSAAKARVVGTASASVRGRPRSATAERAILDATLALLAETGVSGLTIEGVAARAGVSKGTVYRRWYSKLLLIVDAVTTLPEIRIPDTGTLQGDLRLMMCDLVMALRSSPLGAVLPQLTTERGRDPELDAAISRYVTERTAPWIEVIQRGIKRAELPRNTDPTALAEIIAGAIVDRFFFYRQPLDMSFIEYVLSTVLFGATRSALRRKSAKRGRGGTRLRRSRVRN